MSRIPNHLHELCSVAFLLPGNTKVTCEELLIKYLCQRDFRRGKMEEIMKKILKKYIGSTFMVCTLILASFISMYNMAYAKSTSDNNFIIYQEKGQFSLKDEPSTISRNGISLFNEENYKKAANFVNTDVEFNEFLNDNATIKDEILKNSNNGLVLTDIAFTKVYFKEAVNANNTIYYEPVAVATANDNTGKKTTYHNLTIWLAYYYDSWNPGYASIMFYADWDSGGSGSYGPASSSDDYMAMTVAQNHTIESHSFYGGTLHQRSSRGVAYRFGEKSGSQFMAINTSYEPYGGQRLYVGSYVHTWSQANVSFGFSATGPSVNISGTTACWDIACELVKTTD